MIFEGENGSDFTIRLENQIPLVIEREPIMQYTRVRGGFKINWYLNTATGKSSEELDDVVTDKPHMVFEKKNKMMVGVSVQYDEEQELVCLIFCTMDYSSPTTGGAREWKEFCRYYIDKERNVVFNGWHYNVANYNRWGFAVHNGYSTDKTVEQQEHFKKCKWSLKDMFWIGNSNQCVFINSSGYLYDEEGFNIFDQHDIMEPFQKLFGGKVLPIEGNRMIAIDTIYAVNIYMRYKQPKVTSTKKKQLDKYLGYELPEMEPIDWSKIPDPKPSYRWELTRNLESNENVQKCSVVQRVESAGEPMCVVRTFFKSPYYDEVKEGGRIYVTAKEVFPTKTLVDGTQIYQRLLNKSVHWRFNILSFDASVTEGTILSYFGTIIEEIEPEDRGVAIWCFIQYPFMESMYKNKQTKNFAMDIIKFSVFETPLQIAERMFGKLNLEKTGIYDIIGLRKTQLEKIAPLQNKYPLNYSYYQWSCYQDAPIVSLKKLVPDSDMLRDMDDNTFDWLVEFLKQVYKGRAKVYKKQVSTKVNGYNPKGYTIKEMIEVLADTIRVYGIPTAKRMSDEIFTLENEYLHILYVSYYGVMTESSMSALTAYKDYVNTVERLDMATRMKPYFKTIEQLGAMHDMALQAYNMRQDEIKAKGWEKSKEKWRKWEYKNDKFSAIIPEKPDDLAVEGITLSHCVKTYIQRVAEGETNIMFIRNNDEIEKPFYTVEVDNNSIIQQVHGMCNCNATPEIESFVKEWSKAKKLRTSNYDKVR